MQNRVVFYCFLFSLIAFQSCDSNQVFDAYKSVPGAWNKNEVVEFKIIAPDSLKPYNVFVNLRNTNTYKYNNLYLIVELDFPHGKILRDTLQYKMADANGALLGTGLTGVKENKLWYKQNFVFQETGEYTFKIEHAMRDNGEVNGLVSLEGVTDIGLRIESISQQKK